jgi:arylsulfatase A-like enzyme
VLSTWPRVAKTISKSSLAGALLFIVLFFVDLCGARLDYMGFHDAQAISRILHEYRHQIIGDELRILGLFSAVGALFGALGGSILLLRDGARLRSSTPGRFFVWGAASALVCHVALLLRNLITYPQLYAEALFDPGGVRRWLMTLLTRRVPPYLMLPLLWALFLSLLPWRFIVAELVQRVPNLVRGRLTGRAAVGVGICLAGLGSIALPRFHKSAPASERPNILVIAVDSLRADRVFDSGGRFPHLEKLAQKSVRFRQAHVTVPRTFPSFVTLLSGRFPHHHGIRHMFPSAAERSAIGPALPAQLAQAGYRTTVVSDYAGEIFSRTPLGFEECDVPHFDMHTIVEQRALELHPNIWPYATNRLGRRLFSSIDALPERSDPDLLADRAIHSVDEAGERPFFLTVFFSTAHFPYASPWPYYRRFSDANYHGDFLYEKPPLVVPSTSDADVKQIRALYDGAVASVDDAIERLFAHLDASGLSAHTIVVLLADHGENLYEWPDRGMGHGDHLHGDFTDHVPLLVFDPVHHLQPHDVTGIVRDVDLSPTLAGLASVAPPPADGIDLGPLLRDERKSLDLVAFGETEFWFTPDGPGFSADERLPYPGITEATDLAADGDIFLRPEWQKTVTVAKHRSLRTDRWKLIYRPTRHGVDWLLYDIRKDPDERHEISAAYPEELARLKSDLLRFMTSDGSTVGRGGFVVPQ